MLNPDRLRAALLRWARRLLRRPHGTDLVALRRAGVQLGERVFIAGGAFLDPDFAFLISVGDDATVSVNVTVLAHDASTRQSVGWARVAPVSIGARTFIGAGAILLPGVEIGDEAVVAAGSVVRHSVASRAIVGGNPARVIGQVDDYVARHSERLAQRPCWPRHGWTVNTGITPERIQEMRAALKDGQEAYIK